MVAEFSTAGTSNGLGSLIELAAEDEGTSKSLPEVYAAIFCLALLGLFFTLAVTVLERRLLSWHPARRQGSLRPEGHRVRRLSGHWPSTG